MTRMQRLLFGGRVLGREVHAAEPPGWVYAVFCWAALLDVMLGLARASSGDVLAAASIPFALLGVFVLGCAWLSEL
jgi:hypothetical protein